MKNNDKIENSNETKNDQIKENAQTFDETDSKFKSASKLFEHTSLFKSLLKVIFLAILISLATGIYIFADQIMMTRIIPLNPPKELANLFSDQTVKDLIRINNQYNLSISTSMSSIIRTSNSLSAPFITFGIAMALLLGLGTSISFSKALGTKNKLKIKSIWSNGFYTTIVVSLAFSALLIGIASFSIPFQANNGQTSLDAGIISSEADRTLVNNFLNKTRELSIQYAIDYTYMTIGFNLFNCMSLLLVSLLNSEGKNFWCTILIIITNIFNILFDFLLLYFTNLGIIAAAIATNMSWIISVFILFVYIHILNKKNSTFLKIKYLTKFRINWKIIWIIFAIGAASFFRTGSNSLYVFIQQSIYTSLTTKLTFFESNYFLNILGAVQPIYNLFFSAIIGVVRGARTVLSYNYAKNDKVKVKKTYWISLSMAFFYALIFFIITSFALQEQLLWFFDITPTLDSVLYNNSVEILRITMGQLPLFTLGIAGMLFFQSSGKSFWSLMTSLVNGIFVGIPFIFIFREIAVSQNNIDFFKFSPIAIMTIGGLIIFIFSTVYLYCFDGKNKKIFNKKQINN